MSNNIYAISDLHLGHKNMAIKRGFADEWEMYEKIESNWNSIVTKRDTVYILGDVTMEKASNYYLLDTLNGMKRIVMGNHDKQNHAVQLLNYVNSLAGMVKYRGVRDGPAWLTHCPVHPCELEYRVKFNVHGHVHENTLDDKRYINVSCEAVDYTPVLLNKIIKDRL